jgi:ABC-type transporter Mla subunit MlaD
MRRLLTAVLLCVSLPVVLLVGLGAEGGGSGYTVRAIFDNVAAAVPGEDVKVAGAKVGAIESMDVTDDKKAAVVLRIDDDRFTPFRKDAKCAVRPQSLIGEKFVECDPGTAAEPELDEIEDGDGEGHHLLPVARTSSPVDLDLINDILRRPYAERFSILLSEFGTGLAGRGKELNEVISRANPALKETDRVLAVLARQNRVLADLARDSDAALGPLAREKRAVSDFIVQANRTGEATAERRTDIERGIERLPRFLRELRPLMADLGDFAGQAAPVARSLNRSGDDVSRLIRALGPFSTASTASLTSLGDAAETGRPALIRTRPLIRDLASFAAEGRPLSVNLDRLTKSLDETGGIERALDFVFFSMTSINGFDEVGHYLRAALGVNLCTPYAPRPAPGCTANFTTTRAVGAAASNKPDTSARIAKEPAETGAASEGSVPPTGEVLGGILGITEGSGEGRRNAQSIRRRAENRSPALKGSEEPMLEYLLGSDE